MKILMLAPEPFFQPRGTPISVFFRLKALAELGHQVDLVTYHIGEDRRLPGLRIHRTPSLFFIRNIRIGPSLAKILLDLLLFARSTGLCVSEDYDLVFSHEEAAWFGVLLAKWLKVPHLYDMHSSLPQQLENFRYSRSRLIRKAFVALERFVLRNSSCVLVICQDLLRRLGKQGWGHKAVLLENYLDFPKDEVSPDRIKKERSKVASPEEKIILYAGNFEPYQGIALLIRAAAQFRDDPVIFLLVGGRPSQVTEMKQLGEALEVSSRLRFTGAVPRSQVPAYVAMADVLVSPRCRGTNTPLKIYSYLKSGKPVVATNLWTHTQVLDETIAVLAPPDPERFAEGIRVALSEEGRLRAQRAKIMAEARYTPEAYRKTLAQALEKAQTLNRGAQRSKKR